MKKYYLLAPLVCIIAFGCKKTNARRTGPTVTVNAKIVDTGSPAADGCGFMVEVDSVTHETWHALNLDNVYNVNNLRVKLTYHKVHTNFSCGYRPPVEDLNKLDAIQIDAIGKR